MTLFLIANYNGIVLFLLISNIQINILLIINITYETHIHDYTCIVIHIHILNYNYPIYFFILLYEGHRFKVRTNGTRSKKRLGFPAKQTTSVYHFIHYNFGLYLQGAPINCTQFNMAIKTNYST